jgi:Fe2+ transport system protein FeoA/predicted transcriptional regulator
MENGSVEEKIARDDVLRFLRERDGIADKRDVISEVGERELAEKVIKKLTGEGLVRSVNDKLELTREGVKAVEQVYKRHIIIENMLKNINNRGHLIAHFIEHIDIEPSELEKILSRGITSLSSLKTGDVGRIIAVLDPRPSIIARIYGVGLLPGRRIRVLSRTRGIVVVEVGSEARVVAIDNDIASKVLVTAGE